jgi:hypothetical protein
LGGTIHPQDIFAFKILLMVFLTIFYFIFLFAETKAQEKRPLKQKRYKNHNIRNIKITAAYFQTPYKLFLFSKLLNYTCISEAFSIEFVFRASIFLHLFANTVPCEFYICIQKPHDISLSKPSSDFHLFSETL